MKKYLLLLFSFPIVEFTFTQIPDFQSESDSAAITAFLDSMTVFYDSVEATIQYQTGTIEIANGTATLQVPDSYKFIGAEQSQYILTELYGNPPDSSITGILMPAELGVTFGDGVMFVLYYQEIGHVDDKDANKTDADELMEFIRKDALDDNRNRISAGLESYRIIGWAHRPVYDEQKHELSWGKELKFDSDIQTTTLNYNIVFLGRKGVITMNAVATMNELKQVEAARETIRQMINFNPDFNYDQFNPQTDTVSVWTINGLITGTTLMENETPAGNKYLLLIVLLVIGLIIFSIQFFLRRKSKKSV